LKFQYIYMYNIKIKNILDIFWDVGLIYGYKIFKKDGNNFYFIIYPKKSKNQKELRISFELYSLPSKRKYINLNKLSNIVFNNQGFSIVLVSTNKGIFEGSEAIKRKISGELLCKINF
jgi:ribosomal protein S8